MSRPVIASRLSRRSRLRLVHGLQAGRVLLGRCRPPVRRLIVPIHTRILESGSVRRSGMPRGAVALIVRVGRRVVGVAKALIRHGKATRRTTQDGFLEWRRDARIVVRRARTCRGVVGRLPTLSVSSVFPSCRLAMPFARLGIAAESAHYPTLSGLAPRSADPHSSHFHFLASRNSPKTTKTTTSTHDSPAARSSRPQICQDG